MPAISCSCNKENLLFAGSTFVTLPSFSYSLHNCNFFKYLHCVEQSEQQLRIIQIGDIHLSTPKKNLTIEKHSESSRVIKSNQGSNGVTLKNLHYFCIKYTQGFFFFKSASDRLIDEQMNICL